MQRHFFKLLNCLISYTDCANDRKEGKILIVITGLDGSGTSTVAEKLHKMDEGSYLFHTPSEVYSDRHSIDQDVYFLKRFRHPLAYQAVFMRRECPF